MKVKIYGAGSIGNHIANASRVLGWSVCICDTDPRALIRTKEMIYPGRFGAWDEEIQLFDNKSAPFGGFDLIVIGTPPDVHLQLALEALREDPRAILIEKPVCGPDLMFADEFIREAEKRQISAFVGYDHVVGQASQIVTKTTVSNDLRQPITLDVEFREYWGGIFSAHPWLAGPEDSYLGFSHRGGGASGEHSHAVNLWQHFAHVLNCGRIVEVQATLDFVKNGKTNYDQLCLMNLRTENGLVGRCIQDVVTQPSRKWARIQYSNGYIEWHCSKEPGLDVVSATIGANSQLEQRIRKTRPDDFIEELKHIEVALNGDSERSPVHIKRGLDTMLVVAACHLSHQTGRQVSIDYSKGYTTSALTPN